MVVRRKAAAAIRIDATGTAAHAGANPDGGRSALLGARRPRRLAGRNTTSPPDRSALSVVPTMMRSGEGINVVPGTGELFVDMRADDEASFDPVIDAIPEEIDGVALRVERLRLWPAMDMAEAAAEPLERAAELLGRPIVGAPRGGASDASNMAPARCRSRSTASVRSAALRPLAGRAPAGRLAARSGRGALLAVCRRPSLDCLLGPRRAAAESVMTGPAVSNEEKEPEMARKKVKSVAGKVVAITGGARGIGKCTARR